MKELGVIRAIPPHFSWARYDEIWTTLWYVGRMYEYPCSSGISLIQHGGVGGYKSDPTIHGTNCFTIGEQYDRVLWWEPGRDLLWIAASRVGEIIKSSGKFLTVQCPWHCPKILPHYNMFKSSKLWFHFRAVLLDNDFMTNVSTAAQQNLACEVGMMISYNLWMGF